MERRHLTEQEIASFLDHALGEADRRRVEAHLDACALCRAEVVEDLRLVEQLESTAPAVTPDALAARAPAVASAAVPRASGRTARWRRRWYVPAGTAAGLAAAAVAVLLLRAPQESPRPVERGPAEAGEAAPTLLPVYPPTGALVAGESLRFTWRSSGAETYRVTVMSASGDPVWTADVGDTTVALPPSVHLPRGSAGFWRVDALSEGRSLSSGVQPFRVAP